MQLAAANIVNQYLGNAIADASSEAKNLVSGLKTSISDAAGSAVDKGGEYAKKAAYEAVDECFEKAFGSSSTTSSIGAGSASSAVANALTMAYSDYLKMFLFIGLMADDQEELLRIANLIQANVNNGQVAPSTGKPHALAAGDGSSGSFRMAEAYTYYELKAKVGLKATFFDMPFFTEEMGTERISCFKLRYHSALGY